MSDAAERRVQFDFELDFINGGGIQGQGFRLDLDGDDISDQELGEYIIRDLRLLMVGETRILNKQIIREPHKRRAPPRALLETPSSDAPTPSVDTGADQCMNRCDGRGGSGS